MKQQRQIKSTSLAISSSCCWCQEKHLAISVSMPDFSMVIIVEPDLIATEMQGLPSNSTRNKDDSDLMIAIP